MGFIIIATAVGLVSAALLVLPLFTGRRDAPGRDATDAEVFRDQLGEVERDLAKGVLSEAEAEGARVEISRRLLRAADKAAAAPRLAPAPQGLSGLAAGLAIVGTPALAAALYLGLGAPGLPDMPLAGRDAVRQTATAAADRPSQAEMEARIAAELPPRPGNPDDAEVAELITQLEARLAQTPDDPRGLELYASTLMRLERWGEAWAVQARLIDLLGEDASAEQFANQAEAMVMATGGYVSPAAEQVLAEALRRDPASLVARYYAGLALAQNGRVPEAVEMWERLRAEAPPDAPWIAWLDMMLAEARQSLAPPGTPTGGPTREQIAAADQLTPDERQAMIEGMVSRLETRLTDDGGQPEEWGQLMSSYAALNRPGEVSRVFAQALAAYPDGPAYDALQAHGARLGLAEAVPPTAAPGPTQEDIAAARTMAPEDRQAMIEGMVSRLETRLTDEGGPAEDWYRLMNAYVQLDRKDDAARVYAMARNDHEGDQTSRGFLREQALLLGIVAQ